MDEQQILKAGRMVKSYVFQETLQEVKVSSVDNGVVPVLGPVLYDGKVIVLCTQQRNLSFQRFLCPA